MLLSRVRTVTLDWRRLHPSRPSRSRNIQLYRWHRGLSSLQLQSLLATLTFQRSSLAHRDLLSALSLA